MNRTHLDTAVTPDCGFVDAIVNAVCSSSASRMYTPATTVAKAVAVHAECG